MFDDFRETIRETQARKNLIHELAIQMKIAEAVKAAMSAAGIPYVDEPPLATPEPTPEPLENVVVKEKKPRVKKAVSTPTPNSEENVVLEKKPTKPRQKKASA
jgi:hypothetical protein